MDEKLKRIKQELNDLVNTYELEDLFIYVDDGINIDAINNGKPIKKQVVIEVRV